MISSWYECGSRIINRHTGRAFRCRPKSFVEVQVERLGPEGAMALFDDVRMSVSMDATREAIPAILACLADEREWSATDLYRTGIADIPLYLALEGLVQTGTIEGPSPYANEPTGDLSELAYQLPVVEDPLWDDGGEEYPF